MVDDREAEKPAGPDWERVFHVRTAQGPYGIQELASTLGLSRTTLLYYESLGIVSPERMGGGGKRAFNVSDVFRLIGATSLKNVGVTPKDLAASLDADPFSEDAIAGHIDQAQRRIEYIQAQVGALRQLAELRSRAGEVWEADVERYYIRYDRAETGFHDYPGDDPVLAALLEHAPISSGGALYTTDYFGGAFEVRSGRTVAVANARFIDGLPQGLPVIGGCRCVCGAERFADPYSADDTAVLEAQRRRIAAYMRGHDLKPAGRAFNPYSLCADDGLFLLLCVPVVGK